VLPPAAVGIAADDRSPWRVVGPGDLPRPPLRARSHPLQTTDLRELWRWRREWPLQHRARIERAVQGGASPVAGLGEAGLPAAPRDWGRERRLLASLLREVPRPSPAAGLRSTAAAVARIHGSPELAAKLELHAGRVCAWLNDLGSAASRRTRTGVQITAALGHGWIEAWMDLVLEGEGEATLVEYAPDVEGLPAGELGSTLLEQFEMALLWKARALEAAGLQVGEAGCFDLGSGRYFPVPELARKLRGLQSRHLGS
jgi:hypothetical protein